MARHELTCPTQTTAYDLAGKHVDSLKTKKRMRFETEIANHIGITRDHLPGWFGADTHHRGAA